VWLELIYADILAAANVPRQREHAAAQMIQRGFSADGIERMRRARMDGSSRPRMAPVHRDAVQVYFAIWLANNCLIPRTISA
jgi:hypothetical protein